MSNSVVRSSDLRQIKERFIELTACGNIEARVLDLLEISRGAFVRMCVEDPEFVKNIEEARKSRAEFWVSKIASSIDQDLDPKEVPSEKLKFEKLVFLAKSDNPERYGTGKTKVDISLDLKQFKLLPPEEAIKALTADPFAIEADFKEIKSEDEELL